MNSMDSNEYNRKKAQVSTFALIYGGKGLPKEELKYKGSGCFLNYESNPNVTFRIKNTWGDSYPEKWVGYERISHLLRTMPHKPKFEPSEFRSWLRGQGNKEISSPTGQYLMPSNRAIYLAARQFGKSEMNRKMMLNLIWHRAGFTEEERLYLMEQDGIS